MIGVRRFLIASSLARIIRKERGVEARIVEGHFPGQFGRTHFVSIEPGHAFLVLTDVDVEGGLAEERAEVPPRHAEAAVEPRGGTNVGQEAFPAQALPPGGGYVMKQPDQTGRWEVSTYVWMPSQIVVNQGDEVTLEFVGINGASHPTEIKGLDKAFTLQRGHVTRIEFRAERPGVYPVICHTHTPSMRGEIVILPKT